MRTAGSKKAPPVRKAAKHVATNGSRATGEPAPGERAESDHAPPERAKTERVKGERAASRAGSPPQSESQNKPRATTLAARRLAADFELSPANYGDHLAIHRLLRAVFQGPSQAEFQAELDEPGYDPTDRLVVRLGSRIVCHARLTRRTMCFGPLRLPVGMITQLATLPEYRSRGLAAEVVRDLELRMAAEGCVAGLLEAVEVDFFSRLGWSVCGRYSYSTATARDILAGVGAALASGSDDASQRPPLTVRLWRHVEDGALMRLYEQNCSHGFGALARSRDYWRWLVSRRAFDRLYVAVEGQEQPSAADNDNPAIVGYAVVRDGRIVELMTEPARRDATAALLARVCSDAIERDEHIVRVDAPPDHGVHEWLIAAGGQKTTAAAQGGFCSMMKLFDPWSFLRRELSDLLRARAKRESLPRPVELGLLVDGEKRSLAVTARGVKLTAGRLGRSYLTLDRRQLTQLCWGHLDPPAAIEQGVLQASTGVAATIAGVLFPALPLWRPPLDGLEI